MYVDRATVERITKRQKFAAMRRKLDEMGIRYKEAADGEPLVRERDLDDGAKQARNHGPRWDRINA